MLLRFLSTSFASRSFHSALRVKGTGILGDCPPAATTSLTRLMACVLPREMPLSAREETTYLPALWKDTPFWMMLLAASLQAAFTAASYSFGP